MESTPPSLLPSLIDVVDAGIIVIDSQRRIAFWNKWISRASDIEAQTAIGSSLEELIPSIKMGRLPLAISDALEFGNSSFLSTRLHVAALPLRYRDGRQIVHNVRVRPLASDRQTFCLVQVDDITDAMHREAVLRDRQNARYRAVVDSALDAIITTDENGVIQWMNSATETHFGFDAEEAIGRHIGILLENPADWPSRTEAHSAPRTIETLGRRKHGAVVHLEISTARWLSDGRSFVTGILRDITERKRASEALGRLNEDLERKVAERTREREEALKQFFEAQKMESIGQLTGGLAHDFNNLLGAVLANLDLLRKRLPDEPKFRRLLDGAIHGAERGAAVTKRLLAFARRQELRPERVDIFDLVDGMGDLLQRSLGTEIQIRTNIPSNLPAVKIDANQLELALLNIAVNARDAMPFGGSLMISAISEGFIDNAAVKDLAAGDYVRLTIADTGVGMNDVILAKAREPFFTTKGPGKGTGLGLSMVHGLAIQSGGALRLSSTPGKGTTVDLWLPISKADEKSREPTEERPFCQSTGQRWRVLLVDDDALIRMGTADMLEDLGHEVLEANSGTEALSILHATAGIDVVITDQAMPGMRGTDLAAHIGQLQPSLPVILATGYAELPNSEACALPQLAKPYRQQEVAAMLEAVLGTDRDAAPKSLDRTPSDRAIG